jgi:outer membrane protein
MTPLATSSPMKGSSNSLPSKPKLGRWRALVASASLALCGLPLPGFAADSAQSVPVRTFTVQEAIEYALANYPAVQAAVERYIAARGGVGLARTNYLPNLSMIYQDNRATRNNVAGVLMPQSVIPNPSGSVLAPSSQMFWGSGAGVLLNYDVLDFGYRRAQLRAAQSSEKRSEEDLALTRLDVAAVVADASLLVLAANQQVQASQADVDRRTVFAKSVHALVDAHLRPGADASRVDAELAEARNRLVLALETQQVSAATFAQVLGLAGTRVAVLPGPFLKTPAEGRWMAPAPSSHPAAVAGMGRIEESQARISVIDHSYYPHVSLQAIASARGSGANASGRLIGESAGVWPDSATNWGAGISITFQPLSAVSAHESRSIEKAHEREQEAIYDQTLQSIKAQTVEAQAVLDAARSIAANAPDELQASKDSELQAVARFKAGLGTIVDVADAQRLLLQAQIDDSIATLNVWRALARLATAQGNLEPFVDLANRSQGGGR